MVKHNPVEDLSEVSVQVKFDCTADISCFLELLLDALKRVHANAHLYLVICLLILN
jgi:hypothetical protein